MALSDTKLLLHCNGADGSASFPDSSPSNHTVTRANQAQVDTAQKKWGTGSALFDGVDDYLTSINHADWDISANWTLDFWIKDTGFGIQSLVQHWESVNDNWEIRMLGVGGDLMFRIMSGGGAIVYLPGTNWIIPDGNWHHIAVCKVGTEWGGYIDGVQLSFVSDADMDSFTGPLYIGTFNAGAANDFSGWLDEIRIVHANWFGAAPVVGLTDTFNVPVGPYWMSQINIGDSWKEIESIQINIGDVWKVVTDVNINIGDIWKELS